MHLIAVLTGLATGFIFWLAASHWVASSILWVITKHPQLAGSRGLKVWETAACGALFAACIAIAYWTARLMIER